MTFHDDNNDEVTPEYMAGYVAYGNGIEVCPFDEIGVESTDWSSEAIRQREVNARAYHWKRGNRDANRDSAWSRR